MKLYWSHADVTVDHTGTAFTVTLIGVTHQGQVRRLQEILPLALEPQGLPGVKAMVGHWSGDAYQLRVSGPDVQKLHVPQFKADVNGLLGRAETEADQEARDQGAAAEVLQAKLRDGERDD